MEITGIRTGYEADIILKNLPSATALLTDIFHFAIKRCFEVM